MFNWLGSGIASSIESIAKEWIDTPEEKANASALMIKTLDPNGLMRRQISNTVSKLYVIYIILTLVLLLVQAFGLSPMTTSINGIEVMAVALAIDSILELFLPITGMFTAIVSASFGVSYSNVHKGI